MSVVLRLVPIVLLCAVLMAPAPVRASTVIHWFMLVFNFLRTLFYYLIPIKRHQMRAIDDTLTGLKDILHDIMPEVGHLRDLEKPNMAHGGYLCLGQGTARNFKTLEKKGSVSCTWENDNTVNVDIHYHLREFHVTFAKFHTRIFGMKKTGSVEMHIPHNTVTIGIQIPNVLNMIGQLTSDHYCILNITKLEITRLLDVTVKVHSDGLTGGAITSTMMTTMISANPDFLKKAVRESLLNNIHLKLHHKSTTVCIDPPLAEEIHRLGLDLDRVYSPAFYQFCGSGSHTGQLHIDEKKGLEEEPTHSSFGLFSRKNNKKPEH